MTMRLSPCLLDSTKYCAFGPFGPCGPCGAGSHLRLGALLPQVSLVSDMARDGSPIAAHPLQILQWDGLWWPNADDSSRLSRHLSISFFSFAHGFPLRIAGQAFSVLPLKSFHSGSRPCFPSPDPRGEPAQSLVALFLTFCKLLLSYQSTRCYEASLSAIYWSLQSYNDRP
ncbi:hypothetical protein BDW75DRAFT_27933 [Aspergillus navahoensis]